MVTAGFEDFPKPFRGVSVCLISVLPLNLVLVLGSCAGGYSDDVPSIDRMKRRLCWGIGTHNCPDLERAPCKLGHYLPT
jgi:hypothetical protein